LFRVSSTEEQKADEPQKAPVIPSDPRRKGAAPPVPDALKSPPDTPFSPPQEAPRLTPQILQLVQLGISAATGGAAMDPRLRGMVPQDLEALRAAVSTLRPEDLDALRSMDPASGLIMPPVDPNRPPGLLPTPQGIIHVFCFLLPRQ